jgi:superfamily II DNA or RNA helicase
MSLELRPLQVGDLSFYIGNKKCLNRSDTATGKTAPTCVMFKYVSDYEHGSSIWVMPKSLLGKNEEELVNWTGLSVLIYRGKPTKAKWRGEQFDVILTTADTLMNHFETIRLMLKKKLTLIACDESHLYYSSITSKRCEWFVALSRKIERIIFLTATVVRGRLDSAFPIIHVIEPRYYGHHRSFMDSHAIRDSFTNSIIGWRNSEKVGKLLERHSISHTFREVYGDKNLVYLPVSVELDEKHRKMYEQFESMAMLELEDESILSATEAGVHAIRCRQILACPEVLGLKVAEIYKDTWLFENILGGQFERVVIFSAVRGEQDRLLQKVTELGFTVEMINGTVSGEKRVRIDERFRRGELQVIIASPITAGVGFNWQLMDVCVFMTVDYLDDSFTQAVARGVRGVRETTLPIYIPQYQKSIEQKVLGILQRKSRLANEVDSRKEILEGLICG